MSPMSSYNDSVTSPCEITLPCLIELGERCGSFSSCLSLKRNCCLVELYLQCSFIYFYSLMQFLGLFWIVCWRRVFLQFFVVVKLVSHLHTINMRRKDQLRSCSLDMPFLCVKLRIVQHMSELQKLIACVTRKPRFLYCAGFYTFLFHGACIALFIKNLKKSCNKKFSDEQ